MSMHGSRYDGKGTTTDVNGYYCIDGLSYGEYEMQHLPMKMGWNKIHHGSLTVMIKRFVVLRILLYFYVILYLKRRVDFRNG